MAFTVPLSILLAIGLVSFFGTSTLIVTSQNNNNNDVPINQEHPFTQTVSQSDEFTKKISTTSYTPDDGVNLKKTPYHNLNQRPVIGILSQGLSKSLQRMFPKSNYSTYFPASYVKFIESSGAQVVPIIADQSDQYYRQRFTWLNGLVLPGGGSDLQRSGYAKAARYIWQLAATSDDYFPILGICLGFELITVLELKKNVLEKCWEENVALPLRFTAVGRQSRLFRNANLELIKIAESENVTINFHRKCLSERVFRASGLSKNFTLIATNKLGKSGSFVSAIEHTKRPVYGLQFHPEKNIFEWGNKPSLSNIPHSESAVRFSQYIGRFFVNEARKSRHRFPSPEVEDRMLIYNHRPEYTGSRGSSFTQTYLFH